MEKTPEFARAEEYLDEISAEEVGAGHEGVALAVLAVAAEIAALRAEIQAARPKPLSVFMRHTLDGETL